MKGKLFLIPTYLSESNDSAFLSPMVIDVVKNLSLFLVENVRTSRRFISSLKSDIDISSLRFEQLDKRSSPSDMDNICKPLLEGLDGGVMSEAGLPALADPGNLAVAWAHRNEVQVIPIPGSSSIQMALTASGFSGQHFTFHGYLPIDKIKRIKALKQLESDILKTGYTQIFMETPFRNDQMCQTIVGTLHPGTLLSISADISGTNEFIKTWSIQEWKERSPNIHKIPAIFSLGKFDQ